MSISVFKALSTVFHSINSPDNSPLSHFVLPVLFLPYWSFQLCICYESLLRPWHNPLWFIIIIIVIIIIIIINPLTARVVWVPQMILQPVFFIFPCSPLHSGTCRTPGLSIPWCCLPASSSVCLVFFPLSLCLAKWFWQKTWWTGNMTIPLQFASFYDHQEIFMWSNCLLDLGTDFLVGNMVFVWDV